MTYDLPGALARRGLKVELIPGWESRGVSDLEARGAVSHWTAGPRAATGRPSLNVVLNGRPDLKGPLANVYLDRQGIAVVVAARTAQHAGRGGWKGLNRNSEVFGTECECAGDGDWTDAQRWAYPRVNAAYCDLGGFGPGMCCGHNEWAPDRKIDIRDFTMPTMRRDVAAVLANPTPNPGPVQAGDPEMRLVVTPDKAVWAVSDVEVELIRDVHLMGALLHAWGQDAPTPMPIPEVTMVQDDANARRARRALQVAAQVKGVDETQLAKDVVTGLAPQIAEALSGKTGISRDDLAAALAKFADSLKS